MKKFLIYHVVGNVFNEVLVQRKLVHELYADTLDAAVIRSQSALNEDYAALDIRDTRSGDLIQDVETQACYVILEKGYQSVPKNILSYVDFSLEINRIICVKQLSNKVTVQ